MCRRPVDWYVKSRRAQSDSDYETWVEGGVVPTLNAFENANDARATVVALGFNWQNGGGYGDANPGLGITEDGVGPLSTSQVPAVAVMGDVTHTLISEGADASEDGSGRGTPVVAQGARQVRRLTPVETERLQGFPDGWTAGQADSHRYRQMGNAVTVNVAHYVASLINMAVGSNE